MEGQPKKCSRCRKNEPDPEHRGYCLPCIEYFRRLNPLRSRDPGLSLTQPHHGACTVKEGRRKAKEMGLGNPETRCAICGVPQWLIDILNKDGPWPRWLGQRFGKGCHRRLEAAHIEQGEHAKGYRVLCHACNLRDHRMSDEATLRQVSKLWRDLLNPRFLWWLNETPGEGGRLHRNPARYGT